MIIIIQLNSIFIYVLSSTASGQLQSARIQTAIAMRQNTHIHKRKIDQLKLFIFTYEFLKISVDLQAGLAAKAHLAEGQWLEEQLNVVKLRMIRVGTRMPIVHRTEGQYLAPLKTFIKNKASEWRRLICSVSKFKFPSKLS
jgi:hypothetical protein